MNLFILSLDPQECARMMMDVHIVKIILEAVQMLSTAKRILESIESDIRTDSFDSNQLLEKSEKISEKSNKLSEKDFPVYKAAHKNHPVCKWVRESYANYTWTLDLVDAMHAEWIYRYDHKPDKQHKSYAIALYLRANPPPFRNYDLTPFAIAMPDDYKISQEWWEDEYDPVMSYRAYYRSPLKRRFATWRKRGAPDWFE